MMTETKFSERKFIAVLGGLLLLTFYPVLLGGQALFYRDYGFLGYPFAHFHREAFWSGEIPFWNSLIHCGVPFFAQWNTMVFYPGSLIYLVFPLPASLAWFCVLHILLGGIGMRRLTQRWTGSEFGSAFAGVSFSLGGVMFGAAIYPNYLVAFGWMPWVFLLTEKACRTGGRNLALAALAGSMQMLSGAPELILMTWMLIGFLGVCRIAVDADAPKALVPRFFVVVLLVAGVCAFQLLPFFELLNHSQRGTASGSGFWSMPAWGWANFFVPLYSHFKTSQGVYVQAGQSFLPTYYLGIIPLWLGVLAVWQQRSWRAIALAVAGLGALLIAMGDQSPIYGMLKSVFPVGFARFPVKAVLIIGFICPALAACAIAWWEKEIAAGSELLARRLAASAGIIALGIVAVIGLSRAKPLFPNPDDLSLSNGLIRLMFLVAGVAAFMSWRRTSDALRRFVPPGCLVLIWLDVMTHTPVLNPTVDASAVQSNLARAYHQQKGIELPAGSQGRVMLRPEAELALHTRMVPKFFDDFIGQRLAMWGNLNLLDNVPKVNGAATLRPSWWNDVENLLYSTTNVVHPNLMDFLGVTHATRSGELMQWESIKLTGHIVSAGQRLTAKPSANLLAWLTPEWNPRNEGFVSETVDAKLLALPPVNAVATNLVHENGSIQFTVNSPSDTVAVIAETFHPGWTASVNGVSVQVIQVNHAFMAVPVKAGVNEVRMTYTEPRFRIGFLITALALAIGCWLWRQPMDSEFIPEDASVESGLSGIVPSALPL